MQAVLPQYPNPFSTARKTLRMTHQLVANETGLTKLYVIRTEQGVYPNPSAKLVNFFSFQLQDRDVNEDYFVTRYREFQRRCRQANGVDAFLPLLDPDTNNFLSRIHPLRYWMDRSHFDMPVMQICKAYCLSPSLVQRYLQDCYMVLTTPQPIREALVEAGYTQDQMDRLEYAYGVYRSSLFRENKTNGKEQLGRASSEREAQGSPAGVPASVS